MLMTKPTIPDWLATPPRRLKPVKITEAFGTTVKCFGKVTGVVRMVPKVGVRVIASFIMSKCTGGNLECREGGSAKDCDSQ